MGKNVTPPKKFVSIHNHTNFSISDALGSPFDHIDAALENGINVFVSTDHGNMSAFASTYLYMKDLRSKGVDIKYICGCEMYLHPDLDEWAALREKINKEKKNEKKKKKIKNDTSDVDTKGLVIENEDQSRKKKFANPLNRRHHLVVLPKSNKGLSNLFTLVSRSFDKGYYRYPRIDYKMLKEYGEDLIVSTACMSGVLGFELFNMFPDVEWEDLSPELLDDPKKMEEAMVRIGNVIDKLVDAVGIENVYAEIQFNKYGPQHLLNRAVLEYVSRNNFNIVATCDSHYPGRDLWKAREIYKALGWLNYSDLNPDKIPKSRDNLMCELYPKNAEQMWESYKGYCTHDFYDDELVKKAMETGWEIAHNIIEDVDFDTSFKLPKWIVPEGTDSVHALLDLCKAGLKKKNLIDNQVYLDRLKKEIKVIHEKKYENYFLLMNAFIGVAKKTQMIGPGRGCFVEGTLVRMFDGTSQSIEKISIGDRVLDAFGEARLIENTFEYDAEEELIVLHFVSGKEIICTKNHKFLTIEKNWIEAKSLTNNDLVKCIDFQESADVLEQSFTVKNRYKKVYDLQVEKSHTYNVLGLAVHNSSAGSLINYLLEITSIDPIRHNLIFERFISKNRCLDKNLFVMTDTSIKRLNDVKIGDKIATEEGFSTVKQKNENNDSKKYVKLTINKNVYITSLNHRWIIIRDNNQIEVFSSDIKKGDKILMRNVENLYDYKNNLYANVEDIELINEVDIELIDLTIENNSHTFFVSADKKEWILTHNSDAPDIDCLDSSHKIVMHDNSIKELREITIGDKILDVNGVIRRVLYKQTRKSNLDDDVTMILVRTGEIYGTLLATSKHRFFLNDGTIKSVSNLSIGDMLKSQEKSEVITIKKMVNTRSITDITVEESSSFRVLPFDVIELSNNFTDLFCVNIYDIDTDQISEIINGIQENQFRKDSIIIRME